MNIYLKSFTIILFTALFKSTLCGAMIVPQNAVIDTMSHYLLKEVIVLADRKFNSEEEQKAFERLKYDVLKVLPYAKYAGYKYKMMEESLSLCASETEKKRLIKECEKEIKSNFESDLRKMTIKQGGILIKLIDRETGYSSYEILKNLKNSLTAFFWQSMARLFGNNLKNGYDEQEDADIEYIIQSVGDPEDYREAYKIFADYARSYRIKLNQSAISK